MKNKNGNGFGLLIITIMVILIFFTFAFCGSSSSKTSSRSNSVEQTSNTCGYQYPDGSVCGKPCNKYDGLCDQHFDELNSTFNYVESRLDNLE